MKKFVFPLLLSLCASTAHAKPYLDIQEIHTPKGLTAWFVQDKTVPVLSLQFSVDILNDGKGVGNLMSTLLDEGAGKRNSEEFQNEMDAHVISIGFAADHDNFNGHLKTTMHDLDLATELFSDALNRPHFAPDAIARMKQAILSNMRFQQMDPDYLAGRNLHETIFENDAYAYPVEGAPETVKSITAEELKKYRGEVLGCSADFHIAVVGDAAPEKVAAMLDKIFGDARQCTKDAEPVKLNGLAHRGEDIRVNWAGAQSSILMAQRGIARQDKDWWAARILDFALGAGQFSSRLMEEVRVKRGLTYGVSSGISTYDRAPLWIIQAGVDPSKADEAVSLIKKTWQEVAENGLTADEITEARNYLIGSLPLALTSTDRIASILLQLQEDELPKNMLDTRASEINAVTPEDIKRVAANYLNAKELTTIIVGPSIPKDKK